jgi:hypothetical protein
MRQRVLAVVPIAAALLLAVPMPSGAQPPATKVALVVRISSSSLFDTHARPDPGAKRRLAALARSLGGLANTSATPVPLAIAPSPVLCDELSLLGSAEAKSVLSAIRRLAKTSTVLVSPYADVRIAELAPDDIAAQIADGRRALRSCTGRHLTTDLFPPAFALDRDAVRALRERGVTVALSDDVHRPAVVEGVELFPSRLSNEAQPVDVAAGVGGLDAAAVVLSATRSDLAKLVTSLAQQPGVALHTLNGIRGKPRDGVVTFGEPARPPRSYRLAVAGAENAVARLRSFTVAGNRLAAILRTSLARARSSAEWNDRWGVGRERARAIVRHVNEQRRLLRISGGSVTFTSRRGSIPVTVANHTTYPVRVRISVSSPKLDFPTGASRTVVVKPPGDTVQFLALARSTGTFPMRVELSSPDRRVRFGANHIDVRSTAANIPALALTGGGLLFLVIWYARRVVRHRRMGATD